MFSETSENKVTNILKHAIQVQFYYSKKKKKQHMRILNWYSSFDSFIKRIPENLDSIFQRLSLFPIALKFEVN